MNSDIRQFLILLALSIILLNSQTTKAETTQVSVTIVAAECADGTDNDLDLLTDYPNDPDCVDEYDNQELAAASPQCNDSSDNDLDGRIDFPADLGCDSALDNSEAGEVTVNNTIQTPGVSLPTDFGSDQTEVKFIGFAYPNSAISLIKDGTEIARTETEDDGSFVVKRSGLKEAIHSFNLVAIDQSGRYSAPVSFSIFLNLKTVTEIRDVLMPPTLSLSHNSAKSGTRVLVRGMAQVSRDVFFDQNEVPASEIISDKDGNFNYTIDTTELAEGDYLYIAKIKNKANQFIKSLSVLVTIGNVDKENEKEAEICVPKADLNNDCKVDIIDFSIAAFWWEAILSDKLVLIENDELNNDGVIDIRDFSLLAFYWTG